jgi:hypothetical protein
VPLGKIPPLEEGGDLRAEELLHVAPVLTKGRQLKKGHLA